MNTTSIPIPPLEPQRGSSLVGKAYWVMLQRVTLIAAAIDVGYILLFMGLGSRPLAIVNFLSIAMYLGAYRLIQKRYNAAALVLIWVEVLGHAALGSLLIGWDSGFHYYLLLFIPAIVVANTRGYAAPLVLALLAYYLGLQALCSHWGPLDPLPVRSVLAPRGLVQALHLGHVLLQLTDAVGPRGVGGQKGQPPLLAAGGVAHLLPQADGGGAGSPRVRPAPAPPGRRRFRPSG
jgi:hypothetical protein